jgi:hypothetical protein
MSSAGLEPETPATKRPQTYALDRAITNDVKVYTSSCQRVLALNLGNNCSLRQTSFILFLFIKTS